MNDINNKGIYQSLKQQLDKLSRHNRQGSYATRKRYYEAMLRFCRFLADEYHIQKLANISAKHLVAYVEYLQAADAKPSTIKTDLSAIRFWHDQMDAKNQLPDNNSLAVELERRQFGGVNRTWSPEEVRYMMLLARQESHEDYACAILLAWRLGLRMHEIYRIDTAIARKAICEHALTIKGKGGKIRTIPIDDADYPIIVQALEHQIAVTQRGHKLFVPNNVPTHLAIQQLETFIYSHRSQAQGNDSTTLLTFHGLRHSYAARKYQHLISCGFSAFDARLEISHLLGHERPDITNCYLASVRDKKRERTYNC